MTTLCGAYTRMAVNQDPFSPYPARGPISYFKGDDVNIDPSAVTHITSAGDGRFSIVHLVSGGRVLVSGSQDDVSYRLGKGGSPDYNSFEPTDYSKCGPQECPDCGCDKSYEASTGHGYWARFFECGAVWTNYRAWGSQCKAKGTEPHNA